MRYRQLCAAILLTFIMTVSTFAGEMGTTFVQPSSTLSTTAAPGEMGTTVIAPTVGKTGMDVGITSMGLTWEMFSHMLETMIQLF